MKHSKSRFLVVFLLLLPVLVFAGGQTQAKAAEKPFKVLRVAITDAIRTNDPAMVRHRNSQTLMRQWTDGMLNTLPDGSQLPDLATSIKEIDNLTWEFRIREDVYFHNGDKVTIDDFIWNLTRQGVKGGMEGKDSPRMGNVGEMTKLEKLDDYSMRIHLGNPNINPRTFYNWDVHPKKYWEQVGMEGFLKQPIGCGPFKWVEGDFTTQIVLDRYENYHGGLADQPGDVDRIPAVDRVIFLVVPDANTRVAALLAGEVDIIQAVPPDAVKLLQDNPNTKVVGQRGTTMQNLVFNTNKAPFNDKRVRQAVAYAIDVQKIIDFQLLGFAENIKGLPFLTPRLDSPFYRAFDDIKTAYAYNVTQAKALLREAGYPNGFSTVIDTISGYSETAQAIAQMLTDVGIQATVRIWESGVITEEFKKGARDLFLYQISDSSRSPYGSLTSQVTKGGTLNYGNYSNPAFEELFWPARYQEFNASQEVIGWYKKAFAMLIDDLPFISLFVPEILEATRSNVKNYYPHDAGRMLLYKVDIAP